MNYQDIDKAVQEQIIDALFERQKINANKQANFPSDPRDLINPSVLISREYIRVSTGRDKVRDVVMDAYENALQGWGRIVERVNKDAIKVTIVPERDRRNEFVSVKALMEKNRKDLDEDPEFGEPIYP